MVESLPDHIIEGGSNMVQSVHFQREKFPFPKLSVSGVFCIEVSGIGIPASLHEFLAMVSLYQIMMMCRHESFRQQPGFRFQNGQGQTIEPHDEVRFASVHNLVVGRKTQMDSLSHSIPFSTIILQLQP